MADAADGARLAPGDRRSARRSRLLHVGVHVVEGLVLIALAAVALLALRLSSGPIAVEWLRDRIASNLQERIGAGYAVELGSTSITHDPSWGVGLGFHDLKLRDRDGRTVLSAPRGRIGVDPFVALVGGVKVRRLELDDLGLRLRVAADGALSIAAGGDDQAAPISLPVGQPGPDSLTLATLTRAGALAMAGAGQALDRLTLANARFEINNEATGRSVTYHDFNLVFDRSGDEGIARLAATGPAGRWRIEARAEAGDRPTLALEGHDVSLADLETFDKRPPPVFVEGPISFKLDSRLAADGSIESLTGQFAVGAGKVRLNNPDALPLLVDEASGQIVWDAGKQRIDVEDLSVLAAETQVRASGWVAPPGGAGQPWRVRLESRNARFGPERRGEKSVPLDLIVAAVQFLPPERRFIIDELSAKGPTFDGGMTGEVAPDGEGVSLKLRLELRPSVTQDAVRLWPQFINPDVRDWASHNMHGGKIEGVMVANWSAADLDAMDHKRAVAADSVHGTFSTHDVGVDLLPGLPPMISGAAAGTFTGRDFRVAADRATMDLTATRRVSADNLVFVIPDTSPRDVVDAQAKAHLSGTADSLADLLNREPLRKQAGLQIDPATVRGQAAGELTLDLKLGKTAKPEDTQFHATGALTNLTLDRFIGPEKFENGSLTFAADRSTLTLSGEGQAFGSPVRLDASRQPGDEVGLATLTTTIDQAARTKRGLNFGWLTGPLPIKIKAPLSRASAQVEIDLTPTGIDNPIPGIAKPAGKPGKTTFDIKPSAEGAAVGALAVDFGTVMLRGSADLATDGSIQAAKLTQARLSPGDNLQADIVNAPAAVKASVRGTAFDARPIIKSVTEQGSPSQPGSKDFDLDMKVASVTGANRQTIGALELNFSRRGGSDRLALLRGRIGQGNVAAQRSDAGALRLTSSDAGALLKFADLYTRMEGGDLDLLLETDGDASLGRASVTNFALRDEPAFRALVAAAPASGDQRIDPGLVRFDKMAITFQRSPGRLDIKDAVIFNPTMGLTTEGVVNFARNTLDVTGTFVPAYTVNNLLGRIPLVGLLLGGGANEGVFGITYRAQGKISDPKLTINPLSAIAPGILRKILGVMDGTGSRFVAPDGSGSPFRGGR